MDCDCGPIRQVDHRAPLNDPRLSGREDMDLEDSRSGPTWRTPRVLETTCGNAAACWHD